MKAEINKENKARFFALYWGQKVIEVVSYEDLKNPYFAFLNNDGRSPKLNTVIQLKSLSEINDEDSQIVCKIEKILSTDFKWVVNTRILSAYSTDYLRSRGYALPWMGLSVDEMVESGWIKLI